MAIRPIACLCALAAGLAACGAARTSERIDEAYRIIVRQRRPVAEVCADVIAFVTPGLRVSIAGAKDGGDGTWSVETRSDRPLTIAAA
jgi:hypothetical protein